MTNVLSEKCPSCNAPLKFDAVKDFFKCEYCGNTYTLEQLESYKEKNEKIEIKKMPDMDGYRCSSCGAEIITGENVSSTSCVYCKNTAIIAERLTDLYEPSKIITFKYTKDDAIQAFKQKCRGRLLIPKEFNDVKNIQEIEGLYVPFWLYDCKNDINLNAKCTKKTSWSDYRYYYTKTDTFDVTRKGVLKFLKVPTDGSSRFDDTIMNAIEPYNYDDFKDFNMSYLSGYISEKYDVDKGSAYKVATERIITDSKNYLLNDIKGYTTKTVTSNDSNIMLENTDYVLLPVWVLNLKFKDKIYHFAYNGQTGKMVGEIPVDNKKLIILFISSFILVFCIIIVVFLLQGYRW